MKTVIYCKHGKGLPYVSKEGHILMLYKGRRKIVHMKYATGERVTYEILKAVSNVKSQAFRTFDYATLSSVHKNCAKSFEYLFLCEDCYCTDGKRVISKIARFMSFNEWCCFNEDTGL